MPDFEDKLCSRDDLHARAQALPKPVVVTNGVFDILHRGQLREFGRGARVQAQLVDNFKFLLNHLSCVSLVRTSIFYRLMRQPCPWPTRILLSTRTAPLWAPASAISTTTSRVSRR